MITINNLSYSSPQGERIFDDISFTFPDKKTGLVGKNGSGKTTLLRLIVGEMPPESGKIEADSPIAYMPQDYQINLAESISKTLGIEKKLEAIKKLENAPENKSATLLEIIGDDWNVENRTRLALAKMNLPDIELNQKMEFLSGGQRMKVLLARLLIQDSHFLLLDEPTNNLDAETRKTVYEFIRDWKHGLILVSHDREMLMLMEEIIEISARKLRAYGGNYENYRTQKNTEKEALERQFVSSKQELRKNKKESLAVRERQERRNTRGKNQRIKFGLRRGPKGMFDQMESQANITSGKLKTKHEEKIQKAQEKFEELMTRIPEENRIHIDLSASRIPNGKIVAEFRDISFSYSLKKELLRNISFSIIGPARVALVGANGSGKTTLIRLLLGELQPNSGNIYFPIQHYAYLDQQLGFMEPNDALIKNLQNMSGLSESEARDHLAKFLFAKDSIFKKFSSLSGGERIRAALACALAKKDTPELLVLDEPTNNLDLDSLEKLESALSNFRGALIVISHDRAFLENIGITKCIAL